MASPNNLIKVTQLDPEISGFITGILSQNFGSFALLFSANSGYLGTAVLYVTGGLQTISGQKNFVLSPGVPYSGATGQAPSQLFVTDSIQVVQDQLDELFSSYVNNTGTQDINGSKSFLMEVLVPSPTSLSGAANLSYLNANVVHKTGDEAIAGFKTFTDGLFVPTATGDFNPVTFGQFNVLDSRVEALETGNAMINGFAGVASINGITGKSFVKGCGGITVLTQGNVVRVSGNNTVVDEAAYMSRTLIPNGATGLHLSYASAGFTDFPVVLGYITSAVGGAVIDSSIRDITTSGCNVYFPTPVGATGYQFNLIAGPSGLDVLAMRGEQGADGATITPRGVWGQGINYNPLDYVYLSGASFIASSANLSSSANNPFISPATWALATSGNGAKGDMPDHVWSGTYLIFQKPLGGSGTPVNLQGTSSILFRWKGNWSPTDIYGSGDAVYLSGSSYGYTGTTNVSGFGNSPITNASWNLVVSSQAIDTGAFYPRNGNPDSFVTSGQTGTLSPSGHGHNYVRSLNSLTGAMGVFGAGTVSVSASGNNLIISGLNIALGGGGGASALSWRGDWNPVFTYTSGDGVVLDGAVYYYTGGTAAANVTNAPISLHNTGWVRFGERPITFHTGTFDANHIYYKNDLAFVDHGGSGANISVQFINTSPYDVPVQNLNPYSGFYNSFVDCDSAIGYNLMSITVGSKVGTHENFGRGSSLGYIVNDNPSNENGSGYSTLTCIRGQTYYFDCENATVQTILSTSPIGGSLDDQYTAGVSSGLRCVISEDGAFPMSGPMIGSGTIFFHPSGSTPDTLYLQSATGTYMGVKIRVVDRNPWEIMISGAVGKDGATGEQGEPGLAFAWRGNWASTGFYIPYDAVYYQGGSWATFNNINGTPPTDLSPYWFPIAKAGTSGISGQKGDAGLAFAWKGQWSPIPIYQINEAVYWQGSSWVSKLSNSGIEPQLYPNVWDIFVKSGDKGLKGEEGDPGLAFAWRGNWSSSRGYNSGDMVFFEGSSYATEQDVVSTTPYNAPWFVVAQQGASIFSWRGVWQSGTQYYHGDAVFYAGSSYATQATVSGEQPDEGGLWFVVAGGGADGNTGERGPTGVNWKGSWTGSVVYDQHDLVAYNGSTWHCDSGNIANAPGFSAPWSVVAKKGDTALTFRWRGEWDAFTLYDAFDAVSYFGSSYGSTEVVGSGLQPDQYGVWQLQALCGERGQPGNPGTIPVNIQGPFDSGTPYIPGGTVYYSGELFYSAGFYNVNTQLAPTGYPWVKISPQLAFQGWSYSFFEQNLATGFHRQETFIGDNVICTGIVIGIVNGSAGFSGRIYHRNSTGAVVGDFNFVMPPAVNYFEFTGISGTFQRHDRVGYDISGAGATGYTLFNLGLFGLHPTM